MDISSLIPEFLVFSLAGSSLSITAYSAFRDRNDDKKLLLIIAACFSLAFVVVFVMTFTTMDGLTNITPLALTFYILIFMAILSIIGFIIHRLMVDERYKKDELESAIDIIESSRNGLNSFISLLKSEYTDD